MKCILKSSTDTVEIIPFKDTFFGEFLLVGKERCVVLMWAEEIAVTRVLKTTKE